MDDKTQALRARVVEAIGEEGVQKLTAIGLTVCAPEDLDAYEKGMEESAERSRELARATMRAADLRSMLIELHMVTGPEGQGIRIICCDPAGDEDATIRKVCAAMHWLPDGAEKTPKKAARVGRKGG